MEFNLSANQTRIVDGIELYAGDYRYYRKDFLQLLSDLHILDTDHTYLPSLEIAGKISPYYENHVGEKYIIINDTVAYDSSQSPFITHGIQDIETGVVYTKDTLTEIPEIADILEIAGCEIDKYLEFKTAKFFAWIFKKREQSAARGTLKSKYNDIFAFATNAIRTSGLMTILCDDLDQEKYRSVIIDNHAAPNTGDFPTLKGNHYFTMVKTTWDIDIFNKYLNEYCECVETYQSISENAQLACDLYESRILVPYDTVLALASAGFIDITNGDYADDSVTINIPEASYVSQVTYKWVQEDIFTHYYIGTYYPEYLSSTRFQIYVNKSIDDGDYYMPMQYELDESEFIDSDEVEQDAEEDTNIDENYLYGTLYPYDEWKNKISILNWNSDDTYSFLILCITILRNYSTDSPTFESLLGRNFTDIEQQIYSKKSYVPKTNVPVRGFKDGTLFGNLINTINDNWELVLWAFGKAKENDLNTVLFDTNFIKFAIRVFAECITHVRFKQTGVVGFISEDGNVERDKIDCYSTPSFVTFTLLEELGMSAVSVMWRIVTSVDKYTTSDMIPFSEVKDYYKIETFQRSLASTSEMGRFMRDGMYSYLSTYLYLYARRGDYELPDVEGASSYYLSPEGWVNNRTGMELQLDISNDLFYLGCMLEEVEGFSTEDDFYKALKQLRDFYGMSDSFKYLDYTGNGITVYTGSGEFEFYYFSGSDAKKFYVLNPLFIDFIKYTDKYFYFRIDIDKQAEYLKKNPNIVLEDDSKDRLSYAELLKDFDNYLGEIFVRVKR